MAARRIYETLHPPKKEDISKLDDNHYCFKCKHMGALERLDRTVHIQCYNYKLLNLVAPISNDEGVTLPLIIKCRVLGARCE